MPDLGAEYIGQQVYLAAIETIYGCPVSWQVYAIYLTILTCVLLQPNGYTEYVYDSVAMYYTS